MRARVAWAAIFVIARAAAANEGDPTVELTSPGKAPLVPLRFTPKKGTKQTAVMTMRMTQVMKIGDYDLPVVKIPAMKMHMQLRVTDVGADGDIEYTIVFPRMEVVDEPGVSPDVAQAVRDGLKGSAGIKGTSRVTARGLVRAVALDVPAAAPPLVKQLIDGMKDSLRQLTAPFPEEAVGVGATWTTRYRLKQNGVELTQVAQNRLESLKGRTAKLTTEIVQTADRQPIEAPNLPAGSSVELIELHSRGGGDYTVNLDRLLPVASRARVSSNFRATIKAAGQAEQEMDMVLDMSIELGPR